MLADSIVLADRRRHVLRLLVQEYVRTAQPVSSQTIAQAAGLDVSPATIRNDLAALEALGLLTHPHTSAGRIPTDAGYRYFVHHLMAESELPAEERHQIRSELTATRQEMEQVLHVGTSVLARTAQSAALATAPRAVRSRHKHTELVSIYGVKVLLVLVLQDGSVRQQVLDLDQPVEQTELSMISNEVNDRMGGMDSSEMMATLARLTPFARQVGLLIVELMQRSESEQSGQIYRDGLAQALEAPEFAGGENVRRIVQVFEQRSLLDQIVGELGSDQEVRVLIAGDGRVPELRDISLVISRYGVGDRASGLLGVVGPVRMAYDRSVGAVRYVAAIMSEIVEDMYGP